MPASALELKPRNAVTLLDAAMGVAARSAGVWALTLPAAALLSGAALAWTDAVQRGHRLALPSLLFTAAWFARGVSQGAASHWVGRALVEDEPRLGAALGAAFRRLPRLVVAVALTTAVDALSLLVTLGVGLVFFPAQAAALAVAMQTSDRPLRLFRASARVLGPARRTALGVRVLSWLLYLAVWANVHLGASLSIYLVRKLVGVDLSYLQRFVSLDNTLWLVASLALCFALMEPVRAAAAALLVTDGRVRQEGFDLLARAERVFSRPTGAAAAVLALALAPAARAEGAAHEARQRLSTVARDCRYTPKTLHEALDAVEKMPATEHTSLTRMLEEVEDLAYGQGDCKAAKARLTTGMPLIVEAARAQTESSEPVSARAKAILARPEFAPDTERPEAAPPEEREPPDWLKRSFDWLDRILKKLFEGPRAPKPKAASGGALSANAVAVAVLAGVLVCLGWIALSRSRARGGSTADVAAGVEPASEAATEGALSRAPEGWSSLADELAASGAYREAVRSLYLASLSRLHRSGAIHYDPASSNGDYLRGFRGSAAWRSAFRELTDRFDGAYYGRLDVGEAGYGAFRSLAAPLLAPAEPDVA